MDTSQLNEALASSFYDKIADICDDLMLQAISPYFFLFIYRLSSVVLSVDLRVKPNVSIRFICIHRVPLRESNFKMNGRTRFTF